MVVDSSRPGYGAATGGYLATLPSSLVTLEISRSSKCVTRAPVRSRHSHCGYFFLVGYMSNRDFGCSNSNIQSENLFYPLREEHNSLRIEHMVWPLSLQIP